MRITGLLTTTLFATLTIAVAGCTSEEVETHGVDTAVADAKPAHRYVISAIDVPDQLAEEAGFSFDLDADDRHVIDNKASGLIRMAEANLGRKLQPHIDAELAADRMNTIVELHSDGFGDQLDVAIDLRPAVREDVGLRAAAMTGPLQRIYGRIQGGRFITQQAGQVALQLAMFAGQAPMAVELIGARLEGQVGPSGLSDVVLAGGITFVNLKRDIAPALHQLVVARVASGPNDEISAGLLQLFDANKDGTMTAPEFISSNFVVNVLSSDVDVADDSALPFFVATADGNKESLSIGLKFQAVSLGF